MKIYLIRHGETTGDLEDRFGGDYDDHLSENGCKQARELALKLGDKGIELIYHSPRVRAIETAKELEKTTKSPLIQIEDIRERNGYGVLTGLTRNEARERYPDETKKIEKYGFYHDVTNSESYDIFKERVIKVFKYILDNNNLQNIAIVSHGGIIRCFVKEYLNIGELAKLGDCAILELEYNFGELKVINMDKAELK